jgi:cytoskeleton protein RodZ
VGSFGDRLQREREMRGISLEEIAEATKIGTRMLAALEQENFDKLPGGIFNKGFVRAYARYLGINEEEAVSDYMAAADEIPASTKQPDAEVVAQQRAALKAAEDSGEGSSSSFWPGFAALVLIGAFLWGGWQVYSRRKVARSVASPQPVITAAPVAQAAPVATLPPAAIEAPQPSPDSVLPKNEPAAGPAAPITPSAAAELKSSTAAESFVVQIRATQPAWVHAVADGKVVVDEELKPSNERSITAKHQLVLKTGNAGGVEVSYNGKPAAALGTANQVRTVTFTSEGVQR